MLRLAGVTPATPGFDLLLAESAGEGFGMLRRFAENWQSGANRFDRPGEAIFGAWREDRLLGMCGRNRDPYDKHPRAGRVRHLYVSASERQAGTGRLLIAAVIDGAAPWFDYLNTNCPPEAAPFYERLGFQPADVEHVTHRLAL